MLAAWGDTLCKIMAGCGIKPSALAAETGLSLPTVLRGLRGGGITLQTASRLAAALGRRVDLSLPTIDAAAIVASISADIRGCSNAGLGVLRLSADGVPLVLVYEYYCDPSGLAAVIRRIGTRLVRLDAAAASADVARLLGCDPTHFVSPDKDTLLYYDSIS